MNKTFVVLGILLLTSTAFAVNPLMEKYWETKCWETYTDNLITHVSCFESVPPYLSDLQNDLDTAMAALWIAANAYDEAAFNEALGEVTLLVRQIQGAYIRESIGGIIGRVLDVSTFSTSFSTNLDALNTCLESPGPV